MEYVYGAVWFVIALLLIFKMSKENKIFYLLGGYFVVLGFWWILDPMLPNVQLFEGFWRVILTVISGITLLITGVYYYKNIYKKREK